MELKGHQFNYSKEQLEHVARCLYSLDPHYCRYEDAKPERKAAYRRKAHLAYVWWKLELTHNPVPVDTSTDVQ